MQQNIKVFIFGTFIFIVLSTMDSCVFVELCFKSIFFVGEVKKYPIDSAISTKYRSSFCLIVEDCVRCLPWLCINHLF